MTEPESAQTTAKTASQRIEQRILPYFVLAEIVVYGLIGLSFLVSALGMLVYSIVSFPDNNQRLGFPLAIVTLINDLLLVMIIMEVLRTIVSYLEEQGTSLRPFLFIAAISATRRVLAIGAQMSVQGENLSPEKFQQAMVDLGVNAGAILVIALALFLLDRYAQNSSRKLPRAGRSAVFMARRSTRNKE
jgi:uncharacterized membrane protein (DUF373 family)